MSDQQPEALRLADALDSRREPSPTHYTNQAAAELRRLHEENEDYGATIDYLTCENAEQIGEIVALKEQRDDLLEALKGCLVKGSRWHPCDPVVTQARAAIAKVGGANND